MVQMFLKLTTELTICTIWGGPMVKNFSKTNYRADYKHYFALNLAFLPLGLSKPEGYCNGHVCMYVCMYVCVCVCV